MPVAIAVHRGVDVLVAIAVHAVGQVVGQLAKIKGARAVGIAGGAEKCAFCVQELGFDACVDCARTVARRIETLATTVIERAQNTYRKVEGLAQLRAGRMRTLVDATYHIKSKKTYLRADTDVKIDGKRIHLG